MSKKAIYLIIFLLVFTAGGSCSRYHKSAYHGPNRVRARPHKEWKKPKSRYKRLSNEGTEKPIAEDLETLSNQGI